MECRCETYPPSTPVEVCEAHAESRHAVLALVEMVRALAGALREQYAKRECDRPGGPECSAAHESADRHIELLWAEAKRKTGAP